MLNQRLNAYALPLPPRSNQPALAHNFTGLNPQQQADGRMSQTFQALQGVQNNAALLTPGATGHLDDAQLQAQFQAAQQRGSQGPTQISTEATYGHPGAKFGSTPDQREGLDPNYTPGYGYSSQMNSTGPSRTPDDEWREMFPDQQKPAIRATPTPTQMTRQPGYGFDDSRSNRMNAYA